MLHIHSLQVELQEIKKSFLRQKDTIEKIVEQHLASNSLSDWSFAWDHARRRLGSCRYIDKKITLSRYFVACNEASQNQILDTILHEIAHALAWKHHQEKGHGPYWRSYCAKLGAIPKTTASSSEIIGFPYKYYVKIKNTNEIVGKYYRKPKFARYIKNVFLKGRPETKGMLELVSITAPEAY